jgi:hypothetical protein
MNMNNNNKDMNMNNNKNVSVNQESYEIAADLAKELRRYCDGQIVTISRGRSVNIAGPSGAPIVIVEGDQPPTLAGHPYLSTHFSRGKFACRLYTPSTRRIEVGVGYLVSRGACTPEDAAKILRIREQAILRVQEQAKSKSLAK